MRGSACRPGPETPPAVRRALGDFLPLGGSGLQTRMGDEQVPDHPLDRLGVWGDVCWVDRRHNHTSVCDLGGIATVSAYNANDLCADLPRIFERNHKVWADVLLKIYADDRENQDQVLRRKPADAQPALEHGRPTFIVRPRGQL